MSSKKMVEIELLSSSIISGVFDSRNIQDRALLKVYHKDPAHISFNHSSRALNGDLRVSTIIHMRLYVCVCPFEILVILISQLCITDQMMFV